MAETRGEQVGFEWAGQGGEARPPAAEPQPPTKPPRQRSTRRARNTTVTDAGDAPVAANVAKALPSTAPRAEAEGRLAGAPAALPPDDELWDVHAAARFLRRSVSWVYHKAEDGSLPVRRLGGWGLRFIPGELREWVESGGPRR